MATKRNLDGPPTTTSKRRSTGPSPPPSATADVDALVHHLAGLGGTPGQCPPAYSPMTNLLALASPSPPSATAEAAFPLFSDPLLDPLTAPFLPAHGPGLGITLSHLSSPLSSVVPRVQVRLTVPLPSTSTAAAGGAGAAGGAEPARIKILSWAPDGEHLLAVSSCPSSGEGDADESDLLTLFSHRSACMDEGWDVVLQERVGRFGAAQELSGEVGGKKVLSVRWVGEPRRWYPTPPFPPSRSSEPASQKPLYCAPARSAPLSGVAFVCVLGSDELLFIHLPRLPPPLLPHIVCVPLSPPPSSSPSSPSPLSLVALPTPATPLPFAPSAPNAAASNAAAAAAMAAETSPQATMDALVTSLVSSSAVPGALGIDTAVAGSSSAAALKDELSASASAGGAQASAPEASVRSGRSRAVEVKKAAIGAARSRGTAEAGETWFVVARWSGGGGGRGRWAPASRGRKEKAGAPTAAGEDPMAALAAPTAPTNGGDAGTGAGDMLLDDDFSLLADFTSLDEAFGAAPLAPAPPAPAPALPAAAPPAGEEPNGDDDEDWTAADWAAEEGAEGRQERDKWRVELTEVRVEMCPVAGSGAGAGGEEGVGGPRLTVRPQPPLYLDPSPAPSSSTSSSPFSSGDGPLATTSTADPLLTHLTFLGDVSLPHPLSALTAPSASLLADGSEPAVDLCLLSILAHPTTSPSPFSSSSAGASAGEPTARTTWRSTLTSYQLSLSPAGYALSDAFHALEGRRLDAPNVVSEGEGGRGGWAGRRAASTALASSSSSRSAGRETGGAGQGEGGGVVSAVEIRPGGGEWASFVVAVAEKEDGEEDKEASWRTRLVALNSTWRMRSVTLEPIDSPSSADDDGEPFVNGFGGENGHGDENGEGEGKGEGEGYCLPGSRLYNSLAVSSNGGLVCALPFSPASTSVEASKPVITAGALGRQSVPLTTRLSLRLSIALARQTSTSDLSGRVASLPAEQAREVMEKTAGVLQKMLGENGQLEGNALGWELLGVVAGVYSAIPSLRPLSTLANHLLSLSLLVHAFTKSLSPLRGSSNIFRVEEEAIWPLVGWTGWFCGEWLDEVLSGIASRARRSGAKEEEHNDDEGDPTFLLLHPLSLSLLLRALDLLISFRDFLIASSTIAAAGEAGGGGGASETVELGRAVVEDVVRRAGGGVGLEGVREVVKRVKGEVLGGDALTTGTKHSPPLLIGLTLPASLAAQATAARQIVADSFPSLASSSLSTSLPTPPRTPTPLDQGWDAVRRARLIPGQSTPSLPSSSSLLPGLAVLSRERQCVRCGRRTAAAETSVVESAVMGGSGRWRRWEEEWEGRCVCGGGWVRWAV
ncbi:hypothetical protein JCM6882_008706 [Rhodosporidiobolus microsporus]